MVNFTKRNSAPSDGDLNYRRFDQGGHNYAIEISHGSVLPNCVGYAWGRWRELLGKFHNLSRANAEDWWGKNDGYERSQTPRLGSVICWRKGRAGDGRDGAGHVAIVEDILSDGSIVTSNSAYQGSHFYMRTLRPPFSMGSAYTFQGFIHPPVIFEKVPVQKPSEDLLAKGTKVVVNGALHRNSQGVGRGRTLSNHTGTITIVAPKGSHPYHIDGLGWVSTSSVKLAESTPTPEPVQPTGNEYGQNVSVGQHIEFSYIRASIKGNALNPYFKTANGRGYGVVKKIHSGYTKEQGAYEVALNSQNGSTIGFVSPINTY